MPEVPPVQVTILRQARLLWPDYSVVANHDYLLRDTSFWGLCDGGALHRHPLGARWLAPSQKRLRGRTLSLASDFTRASFGHALLDGLPRLEAARRAGYSLEGFDWIVLPMPAHSPTLDQVCAAAGLQGPRIVSPTSVQDFVCDELVVTTFPGAPGNYGVDRNLFGTPPGPAHRRIYLSRQKQARRRLTNADEIESLLVAEGFEIVVPESDPDVLTKCREATVIAGIEGSNMVHQLFAPAGAVILYFVDSEWRDLPYVPSIAASAGHACICVVGKKTGTETEDDRWKNAVDFRIELHDLTAALAAVRSLIPSRR